MNLSYHIYSRFTQSLLPLKAQQTAMPVLLEREQITRGELPWSQHHKHPRLLCTEHRQS